MVMTTNMKSQNNMHRTIKMVIMTSTRTMLITMMMDMITVLMEKKMSTGTVRKMLAV
ncbi:hypothetical protein GCM10025791_23300 [Halioxenophilus aromaticivorans]|uniref:Uncharacterized protein n=1 Tax=Halioxenophilus aromaticivorans TaxID=1306992 RepID=A0AAV3U2X6_9ALTE